MSENWGRCKDCRWINPAERNGYKWHCECYGTYEDPDEIKDCKNYDER